MPLRSSQRVPRGATQLRSTADRAQTTVAQRKSRRIARKAGEPGPSGWKHVEDGDERDLVPPSDVEEYEAWKRDRAGARQMDDLSSSPLERSSTAHGSAQVRDSTNPSSLTHIQSTQKLQRSQLLTCSRPKKRSHLICLSHGPFLGALRILLGPHPPRPPSRSDPASYVKGQAAQTPVTLARRADSDHSTPTMKTTRGLNS